MYCCYSCAVGGGGGGGGGGGAAAAAAAAAVADAAGCVGGSSTFSSSPSFCWACENHLSILESDTQHPKTANLARMSIVVTPSWWHFMA